MRLASAALETPVGRLLAVVWDGRLCTLTFDADALGARLPEADSGSPAVSRRTPAEAMAAVLAEEPADLSTNVPPAEPGLERIVLRCSARTAGLRFQAARDVSFALEAIGETSVHPSPAVEPGLSRPRRRRRPAALADGGASLIVSTALHPPRSGRPIRPGWSRSARSSRGPTAGPSSKAARRSSRTFASSRG